MFAIQVAEKQRIFDFGAANSLAKEILENPSTNVNFYSETIHNRLSELKDSLKECAKPWKMYGKLSSWKKLISLVAIEKTKSAKTVAQYHPIPPVLPYDDIKPVTNLQINFTFTQNF